MPLPTPVISGASSKWRRPVARATAASRARFVARGRLAVEQFAAAAALQHEEADRARQVAAALGIDRRQQRVDRQMPPRGDLAQRLPECLLKRYAGRVSGDS